MFPRHMKMQNNQIDEQQFMKMTTFPKLFFKYIPVLKPY